MNRRQLLFELVVNGVLPYLVYAQAKSRFGASETEGLMWATVIPALMVMVGLVRQRKVDTVAIITLFTLGISVALAALTHDARLLQLRESYLSAALGGMMLLSAVLGRPFMLWLAPRVLPPEKRALTEHPKVRALLTSLTWIWGAVFSAELALKWWMVEHLTIGQVLALGPVLFVGLTALGVGLTFAAARRLRDREPPPPPGVFRRPNGEDDL